MLNDGVFDDPNEHILILHAQPEPRHPKLTGYRIIVISLTTIFGVSKAALAYQGESAAPTTLEWVLGVVVAMGCVYWLGLYETESKYDLPWLFETNYWMRIRRPCRILFTLIFGSVSVAIGLAILGPPPLILVMWTVISCPVFSFPDRGHGSMLFFLFKLCLVMLLTYLVTMLWFLCVFSIVVIIYNWLTGKRISPWPYRY
ncbi:hypothetical protein BD410DRAFT_795004 [Rickenella mellea]|uniref:Uncharacterized protein n=1 Tax=Rickenella mellea TaxID=50990 RepID=A0A4Y7PQG2_9AGAM|nr:hypothetical protein BD410DRAFT_795004 [Rickenella mellea]